VGIGLRAGIAFDTDGNPSDPTVTPPASDAALRADQINARPYFGGQIHDNIAFEGNLDFSTGGASLLDAVVKLQIDELFNVWMGQFLPPSSRANLSGPYYQNNWNYPLFVQGFPFDYAGRDRGLAFWGQVNGGAFKYQVGAFDLEPGNPVENARIAARVVANFLDPEPGYYNSSTYYGGKDVFAIGATLQAQDPQDVDADMNMMIDNGEDEDKMLGVQFDVLYENNMDASGVLSLEGSFWLFDTDPAYINNPVNGGPPIQGKGSSFFVLASWLAPDKAGIGQLQPNVRLQMVNPDDDALDSEMLIDGGLNYIIDGHNTRLHLVVSHNTATEGTAIQAGTQLQMW
ncbi:MAG: hypothetical protein OXT09_02260, partial [Myxococcales bacterium]|nr:hypothetical protein [Myxococcales bacterium]